jgi:hypothetical protein
MLRRSSALRRCSAQLGALMLATAADLCSAVAGVMCPWALYQAYGDTAVLRESWDSMVRFVDFCIARCTSCQLPCPACQVLA